MGFNFDEVFSYGVLRDYIKERKMPEFLGSTLFPESKIQDIDLAYIKGANNNPVSASVHSFDSETEIASRDAQEAVKQRLALIKRKIRMGEELLIKLNTPRTSAELEKAKQTVFNDAENMFLAVKTRIEAMRMEMLTTGKIAVSENGVKITLDYQVPGENIKTLGGTSVWNNAGSDPIKDIMTWMDDIVISSGAKPTRVLTSGKILSSLISNDKVRKDILGAESKMLTKTMLNDFFVANDLPKIATYDDRYRVQGKDGKYTARRYFDEDKFVMFGDGNLGETIYGLTPEEVELQGKAGFEISENDKVLIQIYRTQDPVSTWTKAVATALPTFPAANEVVIAKVN